MTKKQRIIGVGFNIRVKDFFFYEKDTLQTRTRDVGEK